MRRWLILAGGWGLVGLGLIGMILPVLQGALLLALGGAILANELPWVRLRLQTLHYRHPKGVTCFGSTVRYIRQWIHLWLK